MCGLLEGPEVVGTFVGLWTDPIVGPCVGLLEGPEVVGPCVGLLEGPEVVGPCVGLLEDPRLLDPGRYI